MKTPSGGFQGLHKLTVENVEDFNGQIHVGHYSPLGHGRSERNSLRNHDTQRHQLEIEYDIENSFFHDGLLAFNMKTKGVHAPDQGRKDLPGRVW